mmetsp:Transcript_31426/g.91403  ORF Transcript_31426/g.91403 Transcript_31426/m.91403 type:complete len:254 (+) Transcript_31426:299-1060(+)
MCFLSRAEGFAPCSQRCRTIWSCPALAARWSPVRSFASQTSSDSAPPVPATLVVHARTAAMSPVMQACLTEASKPALAWIAVRTSHEPKSVALLLLAPWTLFLVGCLPCFLVNLKDATPTQTPTRTKLPKSSSTTVAMVGWRTMNKVNGLLIVPLSKPLSLCWLFEPVVADLRACREILLAAFFASGTTCLARLSLNEASFAVLWMSLNGISSDPSDWPLPFCLRTCSRGRTLPSSTAVALSSRYHDGFPEGR